MSGGLLQMSGVVVDLVHHVERLPAPGEEVEASSAFLTAGGGFNAMVAAKRLGADVAYGGALGSGTLADIARAALVATGVPILQRARADIDQGLCTVLVDARGERSFISHHGAERVLEPRELASIAAKDYDWILLSGYSLYNDRSAAAIVPWLRDLPGGPRFLFDPGPVIVDTPKARLAAALERADWVSANRREAQTLTGLADPAGAATALAAGRQGALVRSGEDGCWLALPGGRAEHVAGFSVASIDTTGAGDAHDGAFIAASLLGYGPRDAAVLANAAAALSRTRSGPATAPDLAEVRAFLAARVVALGPTGAADGQPMRTGASAR